MTSTAVGPGALGAASFANGAPHFNGWVQAPSTLVVETIARAGFASVTLDAQHGFATFDRIVEGIAAAALAARPALVRLPLDGFSLAAQALDAGAAGVIAPMIDDAAMARALVAAVKFPPTGRRSWGPNRGLSFSGLSRDGYLAEANRRTLALAMIETAEALAALDDILAVEGLDGVLIGPNDLSVALSGGVAVDPDHPAVIEALDAIVAAARRAKKPAAIFANTPAFAADYVRRGFPFVCLGPDLAFLQQGAARALAEVGEASGRP